MTAEEIQKMKEEVGRLQKLVKERSEADIKATKEKELEAIIEKVVEKLHPKKSIIDVAKKMVWATEKNEGEQIEDGSKKFFLGQFMKAVLPGNMNFYPEIVANLKAVMSEGTDAQGGYTVPVEYTNEIIKLESEESILQGLARLFPMGTLTRNLPRQLTGVTATWTGEATAKTKTKPTFDRLTQTAKKLAAVVPLTDELLEDNSVGIDQFIMALVAEAMAVEFDRVGFVGNTGAGDAFMGVNYETGVNVVTQAGNSLCFNDVIDFLYSINAKYRQNATLITSDDGLKLMMKLKDSTGQPLWSKPALNAPTTIYGQPYKISNQIPSTLGEGTETAMLWGNWKKYFYYSPRGGYEVYGSRDAGDFSTNTSAFMNDETWYRFKRRMNEAVALPVAFARMNVK